MKTMRRTICALLLFKEFLITAYSRQVEPIEPIDPNASPYEVLGITAEAEDHEIRKAFRKLSLRYHPDKNPGNQIADANFKLVNSAYDNIGDEASREAFDSYAGQTFTNAYDYDRAKMQGKVKGGGDLYKSGLVASLDLQSFAKMKKLVKYNNTILLVKFFAGWCGHCQEMVPEVKRLASLFEGTVVVAAVNCEKEERICKRNDIDAYPTIKLWTRKHGIKGEVYPGEGNNAYDIQKWIKRSLNSPYIRFKTREEFEEKVRKNRTHPWLINWTTTAFRCPPCEGILGALRDISDSLQGLVNVGEIDCKRFGSMCDEADISYYPDLKLYPKNMKSEVVNLDSDIMDSHNFPQIGMLRLIDKVSKALLDHILTEQRRKVLPQKLENVMRYSGDIDRIEEIPELMKLWEGAELQLWKNILEEYETNEDGYEDDILPFIAELEKEKTCAEGDESCGSRSSESF